MIKVFIALGANLASPQEQLDRAITALQELAQDKQIQVSPYYRSAPMGDVPQPDYVNAVASLYTCLEPLALLDALQSIEQQQGRVRDIRWGARTLDLDLLLYGDQVIDHPRLIVPHYGMKQRSFVLVPLRDIAADLILPCGNSVASLIDEKMVTELQQLSPDH
ncbi:2-amino-4-hydroxy-6-hydroxymethyldihydropteridine diphosphokinase [Shewanella sp. AS1]|uniref:2-amino-4-hydroxy-6- hydroxymethyldihydropteridine diphosphokinase n=1 Tax=Shewanella sp. AS1 TaxID=2907626 RepID=UPI001F42442E|nr:2-amino-4-hydroxy-6-hydroxymethyldihydropteridine diphosphokinase [Shewanella sp. AS1]MCE9677708.1 2-amino-4-hydroxy-6-hydroxymethyldihydropteridine diphosphokinase [Shewanella sp. AS1]